MLQNILPWKKEKGIKPDRIKAIIDDSSLKEKEQLIETSAEEDQQEPSLDQTQSITEEPDLLPNEWVKEDQFEEEKQEIPQEELPKWEERIVSAQEEKTPEKQQAMAEEEKLPDIMAWRDKHRGKTTEKEGLFSKLRRIKEKPEKEKKEKAPKGVMALRDKKKEESAWKNIFKNKRVWLVSLGIILIFLLVILIPQIPSFNLDLRDRFDGLFNPPVSTTTVDTPTSIPEEITQTDFMISSTTEVPVTITPSDQATPTITITGTIPPTSVPTSTPTPGPAPFIYLTETESP